MDHAWHSRSAGLVILAGAFAVTSAACGSSETMDGGTDIVQADASSDIVLADAANMDPQSPPTDRAALSQWLTAGYYLTWHCESAPHPGGGVSPHGRNRICSNNLLSGATGTSDFPVGSAAVKELYADDGGTIIGYAVDVRVRATTGAAGWHFFERVPPGTMLPTPNPVEADGTVAEGFGDQTTGNVQPVCVTCHMGAPRDFVWTVVH